MNFLFFKITICKIAISKITNMDTIRTVSWPGQQGFPFRIMEWKTKKTKLLIKLNRFWCSNIYVCNWSERSACSMRRWTQWLLLKLLFLSLLYTFWAVKNVIGQHISAEPCTFCDHVQSLTGCTWEKTKLLINLNRFRCRGSKSLCHIVWECVRFISYS